MALYRKYRPASFAEVVGQEQVTTPLSAALDAGRINHAYLFSGPRGCGKTSSARIMARSLNCEQGPTSTPCGVCESCVSLAPGGAGNLDVTELDAASHNGVEDMRELRDRAYYAPAESRYRIFIIDEAHMISGAGANALLKVVEEPPEHVIFIFATTEPEKIIGTIRSRTHHYPFRLLTPPAMKGLLERTVASEGVAVEDSVYPMVIQAGGGSPRDTLSILDQLLAGAGPDGLTYDLARPLLGVTDLTLIDDTIAALADQNKAGLFQLVDRVIEAGHDPRRFAIDLLDRLRDLMILQAVPDAITSGLVTAPADRAPVLSEQASRFTGPQLTYLATTVNEQISNLRGATSPRLLLEILCAHLLINAAPAGAPAPSAAGANAAGATSPATPGASPASGSTAGSSSGAAPSAAAGAVPTQPGASAVANAQDPAAAAAAIIANRRNRREQQKPAPEQKPEQTPAPEQKPEPQQQPEQQPAEEPKQDTWGQPRPTGAQQAAQPEQKPEPQPEPQSEPQADAQADPAPANEEDLLGQIKARWEGVRAGIGKRNKVAEIMLAEARILGLRYGTLILGHTTGALAERINAPSNNDVIVEVLKDEFNQELKVHCVIGTDPKTAGFEEAPQPQEKKTWNPNPPARETADDKESESPKPQPEPQRPQPQRQEPPRQQAPQKPEPKQAGWRSRIAKATESAKQRDEEYAKAPSFSNGVPLPDEPAPDDVPAPPEEAPPAEAPPEEAPPEPYTRDDEERDMMEAAQTAGEHDHRSATEVAMELLERELGARRA